MINPHVADLSHWLHENAENMATADIRAFATFGFRYRVHTMRVTLAHNQSERSCRIETRLPQQITITMTGGRGDPPSATHARAAIDHPRGDMADICDQAMVFLTTQPPGFRWLLARERVARALGTPLRRAYRAHMDSHGCAAHDHPEHDWETGRCPMGNNLHSLLPYGDECHMD